MLFRLTFSPALLRSLGAPVRAQDGLVTFKSMTPELALELAQATLAACRARGFQVAVAVVDRSA